MWTVLWILLTCLAACQSGSDGKDGLDSGPRDFGLDGPPGERVAFPDLGQDAPPDHDSQAWPDIFPPYDLTPCSDSQACPGETVCLVQGGAGGCVPAYGISYRIHVESAQIAQHKSWDGAADLGPDPFVVVKVGAQVVGMTTPALDTFSPVWNEEVGQGRIFKTTQVSLSVFDSDSTIDELIGEVRYTNMVPIEVLKQKPAVYQATMAGDHLQQLTFWFEPVP